MEYRKRNGCHPFSSEKLFFSSCRYKEMHVVLIFIVNSHFPFTQACLLSTLKNILDTRWNCHLGRFAENSGKNNHILYSHRCRAGCYKCSSYIQIFTLATKGFSTTQRPTIRLTLTGGVYNELPCTNRSLHIFRFL